MHFPSPIALGSRVGEDEKTRTLYFSQVEEVLRGDIALPSLAIGGSQFQVGGAGLCMCRGEASLKG